MRSEGGCGSSVKIPTISAAARMPRLTPVWSTAASHGRHAFGQVSVSSDAPTAHSPPMPSAATNRNSISCHQVWESAQSPVHSA